MTAAAYTKKDRLPDGNRPYLLALREGLLLGADAYLDGGENALVAFHLALVLAEFLDLGEGYVPLVDLYALGCERLCNLG